MTAPGIRLLMGAAGGGVPGFFGGISMLREFWAEDPDWSDPGYGNLVTAWRDNGTLAVDVSVVADGGAADSDKPILISSGIGGKPAVEFRASGHTTGAVLQATGQLTGISTVSCVLVGRIDNLGSGWWPYIIDSNADSSRSIIGIGAIAATTAWNGYHNTDLGVQGGAWDSANHLFVFVIKTNDTRLYIDGTLIATDSSGTATTLNGFVIGGGRIAASGTRLNGAVGYVAQYDGDITAHADYSAYVSELETYYGI